MPKKRLTFYYLLIFLINFIPLTIGLNYIEKGPVAHDEYSYNLMAETFLAGRICNPLPAKGEIKHYENFNLVFDQCYGSRYFPLQGAILAIGKSLFNEPLIGNVLVKSITSMLAFWVLSLTFSLPWALFGTFFFSLNLRFVTSWDYTYWGSSRNVLIGFLMLGAFLKIIQSIKARSDSSVREINYSHFLLFGLAGALFLVSRPYEGTFFSLPLLLYLATKLKSFVLREKIKLFFSLGLLPILTLAFLGYYNHKVTGNALSSPYFKYSKKFGSTPFIFLEPKQKSTRYSNQQFRSYFVGYENDFLNKRYNFVYKSKKSISDKLSAFFYKTNYYYRITWTSLGSMLLLFLLVVKKEPIVTLLLSQLFFYIYFGLGIIFARHSYYISSLVPTMMYLLVFSIRASFKVIPTKYLTVRFKQIYRPIFKPIFLAFILLLFSYSNVEYFNREIKRRKKFQHKEFRTLKQGLEKKEGNYLLFVRYKKPHHFLNEFVYNSPDFYKQKILLARYLNRRSTEVLAKKYPKRKTLILDVESKGLELKSYDKWLSELPSL